jgi:hypothetical protein
MREERAYFWIKVLRDGQGMVLFISRLLFAKTTWIFVWAGQPIEL